MNRWTKIANRCCREPVFWAAVIVAGFGVWLYGHQAGYPDARSAHDAAAPAAARPDAGAGPAPRAARARRDAGDEAAAQATPTVPDETKARRLAREAEALVARGDELILEAGLPEGFLDRSSLDPEIIRRALEDADDRLRPSAHANKEYP